MDLTFRVRYCAALLEVFAQWCGDELADAEFAADVAGIRGVARSDEDLDPWDVSARVIAT